MEVLHEDAAGEAFDASLHPHLVLLKVLVADVVLCCCLWETAAFSISFISLTNTIVLFLCTGGSFKSAVYIRPGIVYQAVFNTLPLVSLKYYLVA